MKTIFYISFLIILSFNLFAQENFYGEIYIYFANRPSTYSITVKIQAIGTVWNQYHYITTQFPGGQKSYTQNNVPYHPSDVEWNIQGWEPFFSIGLYEISVWEGSYKRAWVYIDYRTSDFPGDANDYAHVDVSFNYDVTNKYLTFTGPIQETVINGTYYPQWELHEYNQLETDDLEDYWENSLAVVRSTDNHPKLIWGTYPDEGFSVQYYKIYKNEYSVWYYLTQTTDISYEDVTENYCLNPKNCPGAREVKYRITAIDQSSNESDPSNTVSANLVDGYPDKIALNPNPQTPQVYSLEQNYPNPFNPSTTISYSTKEPGLVQLKVFDILGNEVAEIVNENQGPGSYTLTFDASNLPSGIYFYKLTSGNFTETKKLLLLK